jgi:uncharacterized protein with FMN-binding domain
MKKAALSLFVIAASGAYVWSQSGGPAIPDDVLVQPPTDAGIQTDGGRPPASAPEVATPDSIPRQVPFFSRDFDPTTGPDPDPDPAAALPAPLLPTPEPGTAESSPESPPAREPISPSLPRLIQASAKIPLPRPRPASHDLPADRLATPAAMTVGSNLAAYADGIYTGPVVDAYYGPLQIQAIVKNGRLIAIKVLQYPSDRRTSIAINRQALPMLRDEVVSAQSAEVDIISGATLTSEAFIRSLAAALRQATS